MKITRIALSIVFLFVSIMLVMTTIKDMNKEKPVEKSDLTKVTAGSFSTWNQCNGGHTNAPCGSCSIKSLANGTFTWGCELECTGVANCPSTTYTVKAAIFQCDAFIASGDQDQANTCGDRSIQSFNSIGTITSTAGYANNGTNTQAFTSVSCGRIQADIELVGATGVNVAGRVFGTSSNCSTPTSPPAPTTPPGPTTPPQPTNPPGTTPSLTPTASMTPTKTPTLTPTTTPTITPTETPTFTPSPTPTGPPAPVCAPTDCGVCGWKDAGGVCREGGVLPSGRRCCYKTCVNNACLSVSGDGQDRCAADTSCVQPTTPIVASYKCDARCGICGVSDQGGLCIERTDLPNGTKCCHQACVAQACTQVFGTGADACSDASQCTIAAVPVTIAPPTGAPKPKPPVSGFSIPWYLLAIPAAVVIIGVVL